jgi:hypothetical protein
MSRERRREASERARKPTRRVLEEGLGGKASNDTHDRLSKKND